MLGQRLGIAASRLRGFNVGALPMYDGCESCGWQTIQTNHVESNGKICAEWERYVGVGEGVV